MSAVNSFTVPTCNTKRLYKDPTVHCPFLSLVYGVMSWRSSVALQHQKQSGKSQPVSAAFVHTIASDAIGPYIICWWAGLMPGTM